MRERVRNAPEILLTQPSAIAVVLLVLINEQAASHYDIKRPNDHFAQSPMWQAKVCFGFVHLDRAIDAHETELRGFGVEISNRIDIYRDMRQHFSNLADPLQAAEATTRVDEAPS